MGRFATGDRAVGLHGAGAKHVGYIGQPTPGADRAHTIRGHSFDRKQNGADCVARSLQTIIGAEKGLDENEAPSLEELRAKLDAAVRQRNAEAKTNKNMLQTAIDWGKGGIAASEAAFRQIMSNVLAQYGIRTSSDPKAEGKPGLTMKQLADKLIAKGTPAMLNVGDEPKNEHSVTVQWDPKAANGQGRFLINNLLADGGTRVFTKQQFQSGVLSVGHAGAGGAGIGTTYHLSIKNEFPVIYVDRH